MVLTVPVVEVSPDRQGGTSSVGVGIGAPIGPFTQRGLDEALGLAIGLRAVGTSELVRDAELVACIEEGVGVERRAVVGEQALNRDAQLPVIGLRCPKEGHGALLALVGVDLREGDSAVVVDRHEHVLPACALDSAFSVSRHAMAGSLDAPQLLDVHVQQFAGDFAFIALNGLLRLKIAEPGQASAAQHTADSGLRDAHVRGDPGLQEQLAPQFYDGQSHPWLDGARRPRWP
jgi:hypothetical protein